MRNILLIAGKEIQEGLRNRWVLATTLLLAALALTLTFLGSAPTGSVGVGALDVVIVSLSSLTIFLVPLIALLKGVRHLATSRQEYQSLSDGILRRGRQRAEGRGQKEDGERESGRKRKKETILLFCVIRS